MTEPKTRPTTENVMRFLNGIADERRRQDCIRILEIMRAATRTEPEMWGSSIVGFGRHRYKYESGTKGEWFLVGFASRKQDLTLYIMAGLERYRDLLAKMGKHKIGKGCLYIKTLDDIDLPTLKQLIKQALVDIRKLASK